MQDDAVFVRVIDKANPGFSLQAIRARNGEILVHLTSQLGITSSRIMAVAARNGENLNLASFWTTTPHNRLTVDNGFSHKQWRRLITPRLVKHSTRMPHNRTTHRDEFEALVRGAKFHLKVCTNKGWELLRKVVNEAVAARDADNLTVVVYL